MIILSHFYLNFVSVLSWHFHEVEDPWPTRHSVQWLVSFSPHFQSKFYFENSANRSDLGIAKRIKSVVSLHFFFFLPKLEKINIFISQNHARLTWKPFIIYLRPIWQAVRSCNSCSTVPPLHKLRVIKTWAWLMKLTNRQEEGCCSCTRCWGHTQEVSAGATPGNNKLSMQTIQETKTQ